MKLESVLLVVEDMAKSIAFYEKVLGLAVEVNLGANVVLTGGIALQTKESWMGFIRKKREQIGAYSNNMELYFETEDIDGFWNRLCGWEEIVLVHPLETFPWGQRGIRFYDPDGHIIEVGESMREACLRLLRQKMTPEEISKYTMLPLEMVKAVQREEQK